ncbi:Protein MEI2-like [Melia azedarach]|uniref:Protein MEI2-like n=1 Tax=Melia azedarach TaxID=155640 RepID=A0ACC1Z012_MELAZ|nr:Protein MEI2-like [Melia azedarach]
MEQKSEVSVSDHSRGSSNIPSLAIPRKVGTGVWGISFGTDTHHAPNDASLFSSSLPVLPHEKLNFADSEHGRSVDDSSPTLNKLDLENEGSDPLMGVESNGLGSFLPDDEDELLAGLADDFDLSGLPSQLEDLEDDLFGSGGGMELDFESQESLSIGLSKLNISDGIAGNGIAHYSVSNGVGTVAGEHPYGEHPSRTLFVRNINSNVEDSELRSLFEQYGDIRTLYTACKHRGFVMISYYDIRAARTAMRALQNKPLRRRKLDIHFSIPKDNPSEKDINQGTLVVFNLDASVSNDDLRQIFGAYGEVKEIRETPHKRHHKFIEFYDVRAAEAALRALNRSDINGKRIKLEPSRPGGARRNLMQQLNQELEQDEARGFRHQVGSPVTKLSSSKSPGLGTLSPVNSNHLPGLASILPPHLSNSGKIAPIGKDQGRANHTNQIFTNTASLQGAAFQHSQSFPEQKLNASPGPISPFGESNSNSSGVGTLSVDRDRAFHTVVGMDLLLVHIIIMSDQLPLVFLLTGILVFFPESPETSFMNPVAFGGVGLSRINGSYMMNVGSHVGVGPPGNVTDNGSPSLRIMSLPRHSPLFFGNGSYTVPGTTNSEGLTERSRSRRVESSGNQIDSKKQYQLDLDKIISGEDTRTTLMIKNIPNKYTSKMLLAAIDENHRGTYDFLYLPIDFKNKCNVGYAFINMGSPYHIISFYEAFNGKKWEKFNSEKVASLAYARIQGKTALVTHFQNSSLMNEDKRCRPIVFHSEGQETADQESFLSSNLNIFIRQPDGSYSGDSLESLNSNQD